MVGPTLAAATSSMRLGAMNCTSRAPLRMQRGSPLLRMAHTWAMEAGRPSFPNRMVSASISAPAHRSLLRTHISPFSTSARWAASPAPSSSDGAPKSRAATLTEEFQRRQKESYKRRNQSLFMYSAALMVFTLGFSYAAVPLYRAFCSATGFSGTPITDPERFAPSRLIPAYLDPTTNAPTKRIRVTFNADASDAIPWSFTPQQKEIYVLPGETALAFYTAKNKSDKDIIGIATYNVSPDRVSSLSPDTAARSFPDVNLWPRHWVTFTDACSHLIRHDVMCVTNDRLHLTLPKLNASASRNRSCSRERRSTCPSSSLSTRTCSTTHPPRAWTMSCSATPSFRLEEIRRTANWSK